MKHCVITDTAIFTIVSKDGQRTIKAAQQLGANIGHMGDIYEMIEPLKIFSVWLMPGSRLARECSELCKQTPDTFNFWYQEVEFEEGRRVIPYMKIRRQSPTFIPIMHINCPSNAVWCEDGEGQTWNTPSPGTLLATVAYLEEALEEDIYCSPGHIGKRMMQKLSRHRLDERMDTEELPYKNMTVDLFWHRRPTSEESHMQYVHMIDKNAQYIGAGSSVKLGIGPYIHTTMYQPTKPGIWKITWEPGASPFNGRILPAPFSQREWASTDLIEAAKKCGCLVEVQEGYYWEENATILDKWAKKVWDARANLSEPAPAYRDDLARRNAARTAKLVGNATLGRLNRDYSGELYRPDINRLIISRARSNALYSLKSWYDKGHWPVLVYRDAYYFFSDKSSIAQEIPGILDHSKDLRGYKQEHRFTVTPPLLKAFEEEKTPKLNSKLKAMRGGG